ncbi:MAG: hypothetical protein PF445_05830 [Melioribacteraceae bacterium]|jgi:hypothetical protein|nr:hypothetical protein [Melioribacteraceae bacterium]
MLNIDKQNSTLGLGYGFSGNIQWVLRIFGDNSSSNVEYRKLDNFFGFT